MKRNIIRNVTGCMNHENHNLGCPFWHEVNGYVYCMILNMSCDELKSKRFDDCPLDYSNIIVKLIDETE